MKAATEGKRSFAKTILAIIDFTRQLFRACWLFFSAILILAAVFFCFWKITQGKDLMVITLENPLVFGYFLIAQFFWSYITWYTSRAVGKVSEFQHPNPNHAWTRLRVHFPRVMAFTCYSIIILAFFQLPADYPKMPAALCHLLFVFSFPYYFLLFYLWSRLLAKKAANRLRYLNSIRIATWVILILFFIAVVFIQTFEGLIVMLLVLQACLVLLLIIRRKILEEKHESFYQKTIRERGFSIHSRLWQKLKGLLFDAEDKNYFIVFCFAFIAGFIIYCATIFSVSFSVKIGSFPFVLLAFGVLLILGNIVAFFSVMFRFNLHLVLFLLAFTIGLFLEPHYTKLVDKKNTAASFKNRQTLEEYFYNWLNDAERKSILSDSATKKYPVYFVLANGGASRSGYWVASVLAKTEDLTEGKFSKHLFCLSGASGGSVGNATFFSLLRSRNQAEKPGTSFYADAKNYLGSDFLTYTIARMLGPDVFRHIFPFRNVDDRAAALAKALEKASGKNSFLYDSLAAGFSFFVTQKNNTGYKLPVLCINTTRMQDGNPGVISNLLIDTGTFNKRVDVLGLVNDSLDLKLSSAVVLGASFPYVSPAGRIDHVYRNTDEKESSYFVDGGYFDNSGAGVVNEMIIALQSMMASETDPAIRSMMNKLDFHVLHITNDPVGFRPDLDKVNPLINDLAAPLKTLMGAYGSQTSINDQRLISYLKSVYGNYNHYRTIPLYRYQDKSIIYSMNWVISDFLLQAMDDRLQEDEIQQKINQIKNELTAD